MKFRILSDLHLAMRQDYYLNGVDFLTRWSRRKDYLIYDGKDRKEGIYTLIAGDISSAMKPRKAFFKLYPMLQGAFIEGNHIVYDYDEKSVDDYINECKEEFSGDMKFLENDVYEIPNSDYVVIGCTLWTDFLLYWDGNQDTKGNVFESGCKLAYESMNDYRYGYHKDEEGNLIPLLPKHTAEYHKKSLKFIKDKLKEYKDKKVVMLTHHCPSDKCVPTKYLGSLLNSSYCSNLEYLIKENPNIVAWVCGHCHEHKEFNIDNCKVIMNPIGYNFENRIKNWNYIVEL